MYTEITNFKEKRNELGDQKKSYSDYDVNQASTEIMLDRFSNGKKNIDFPFSK